MVFSRGGNPGSCPFPPTVGRAVLHTVPAVLWCHWRTTAGATFGNATQGSMLRSLLMLGVPGTDIAEFHRIYQGRLLWWVRVEITPVLGDRWLSVLKSLPSLEFASQSFPGLWVGTALTVLRPWVLFSSVFTCGNLHSGSRFCETKGELGRWDVTSLLPKPILITTHLEEEHSTFDTQTVSEWVC